jgi:hypothetical protein
MPIASGITENVGEQYRRIHADDVYRLDCYFRASSGVLHSERKSVFARIARY